MKQMVLMATLFSAAIIVVIITFITYRGVKPFFFYGSENVPIGLFLTGTRWFIAPNLYGVGFILLNTLFITFLAIAFAAPIGILTALFIAKMAPKPLATALEVSIELLSAIPSIVFGVFGRGYITKLVDGLALLFGVQTMGGLSTLSTALVLALMILPTITTLSLVSIKRVHKDMEHGALALGASKTHTYFSITLVAAKSGIFTSIILGVGRALGEATAVSMVAGNRMDGPTFDLFGITRTLTSTMLSNLKETFGLDYDIRFSVGIILILTIFLTNLLLHQIKRKLGDKIV
jgi:phosphate transport system permease protein